MPRPTHARIDLDALRHNAGVARALAPRSSLMAVVKANAYGHGAVMVARALSGHVDALAVACLEEAAELREAGVDTPILLLQGVFSAGELPQAQALGLWLTVGSTQQLDWLEQARLPGPLRVWLKINSGMNRLGVAPPQAREAFGRLQAASNCDKEIVLCTHFACADDLDSDTTGRQLAVFDALDLPGARSAANSAGVLAWPASHYDWIRPGYMLYGNSPLSGAHPAAHSLRPVMTLASSVSTVREVVPGQAVGYGGTWVATRPSRIATVSVGYGDGYPRHAGNGTPVLVAGQRAPLAGRVSMDMITVDVTDLGDIQPGAPVELWGPGLPLAEVAACAGTIGYELTTGMPARAPRVPVSTGNDW